jgi:nucleoside-diphosphate kinase
VSLSLLIVKPDAVAAGYTPRILQVLYLRGFAAEAMKRGRVPADAWAAFYAEHRGKPFFNGLVTFMASGPVVALAVRDAATWRASAEGLLRKLVGATDPRKAEPGTLRHRFGNHEGPIHENAVHASASPEDAARELAMFFSPEEELTEDGPMLLPEPRVEPALRDWVAAAAGPTVEAVALGTHHERGMGGPDAYVFLRLSDGTLLQADERGAGVDGVLVQRIDKLPAPAGRHAGENVGEGWWVSLWFQPVVSRLSGMGHCNSCGEPEHIYGGEAACPKPMNISAEEWQGMSDDARLDAER